MLSTIVGLAALVGVLWTASSLVFGWMISFLRRHAPEGQHPDAPHVRRRPDRPLTDVRSCAIIIKY
jgi:hypothetical protein